MHIQNPAGQSRPSILKQQKGLRALPQSPTSPSPHRDLGSWGTPPQERRLHQVDGAGSGGRWLSLPPTPPPNSTPAISAGTATNDCGQGLPLCGPWVPSDISQGGVWEDCRAPDRTN
mmetsp:Transcript_125430/g.217476  ORF Transcript_125430/g.217476 Transcript_125430/m.217476 type:complete len:117 (-) Transcript_125430:992-1342(-)